MAVLADNPIANTWESCLTNYRVSDDFAGPRLTEVGQERVDPAEAGRLQQRCGS
jgi:hypothetical protein